MLKKILSFLVAIPMIFSGCNSSANSEENLDFKSVEESNMKIKISDGNYEVIFALNGSQAAQDIFSQLPLEIAVENYSSNEKIFYPPKKLSTNNTPAANAKEGTFAYYAPWGDVVMFYKNFGKASGLYEIGEVVSGKENIKNLSGKIRIEEAK